MTVEYINCEQGTEEWLRARMGIPTASEFGTVMAQGRGGAESKTRRTYMLKLIGERMTGELQEGYTNAHMERGHVMEAEARNMYAFMREVEPVQVGFARNGNKGASPDSLIETCGGLEIKTKLPHLQLDVLDRDAMPPEHLPQVQGQIWVCELEWVDFVSYWPNLPIYIERIHRDDAYIKQLASAVEKFNDEMLVLETKIKQRYAA